MALSYGLSMNNALVNSIQNQCDISNYIISVERLNQYMHIPSEAPEVIEENHPPAHWPNVGKVEICDLQVIYALIYYLKKTKHTHPLILELKEKRSWYAKITDVKKTDQI